MKRNLIALGAVCSLSFAAAAAIAGKPPPPPPPPTSSAKIYFDQQATTGNTWYSMDLNGSYKTALPATPGLGWVGMSRVPYAGSFVTVQVAPNGLFSYPDGEAGQDLRVQSVNSTSWVTLISDPTMQFTGETTATFLPGQPAQLSFTAIEWAPGATWGGGVGSPPPIAGFFVVTLAFAGDGSIAGVVPGSLQRVVDMATPYRNGTVLVMECRHGFDWIGDSKIVWPSWPRDTGVTEMRVTALATPMVHTVLDTLGFGRVVVNPAGTRITYFRSRVGLVETDLDGNGSFLWVPWEETVKGRQGNYNVTQYVPSAPQYIDADTLAYGYWISYPDRSFVQDAYKVTRGGVKTNLTSDLSTYVDLGFVR